MSLLYVDSFDTNNNLKYMWDEYVPTDAYTVVSGLGRTGNNALKVLVWNWEYKPGSEFFLVWTQSTSNSADPNKPIFDSLSEDLFTKKIDNIFLMKFTYRFINS